MLAFHTNQTGSLRAVTSFRGFPDAWHAIILSRLHVLTSIGGSSISSPITQCMLEILLQNEFFYVFCSVHTEITVSSTSEWPCFVEILRSLCGRGGLCCTLVWHESV